MNDEGQEYNNTTENAIYIPEATANDSMTIQEVGRLMQKGCGNVAFASDKVEIIDEDTNQKEDLVQSLYTINGQLYAIMSRDGDDKKRYLTGEGYRVEWKNHDIAIASLKGSITGDDISYHAAVAFGFYEPSGRKDAIDKMVKYRKERYKVLFETMPGSASHSTAYDSAIIWTSCQNYFVGPELKWKLEDDKKDQKMEQRSAANGQLTSNLGVSNPIMGPTKKKQL